MNEEVALIGTRAEWRRLPANIRLKVQKDAVRLVTELRNSIAEEAGLTMPIVRIEPFGWIEESAAVIYGKAAPIMHSGGSHFGVILPESDFIVIEDQRLLRQLLVHEFDHCFYFMAVMYYADQQGITKITEVPFGGLSPKEMAERTMSTDEKFQLDPKDWFGTRDAQEFLWYDSPERGVDAFSGSSNAFFHNWVHKGLPVKSAIQYFKVASLDISDDVVTRLAARQAKDVLGDAFHAKQILGA
jgi:hypothetical protein